MNLTSHPLFGVRTWTLLTSGFVILMLVVADLVLRAFLRRKARAAEREATQQPALEEPAAASTAAQTKGHRLRLMGLGLRQLAGPLTLLLWAYGLHLAVSSVLAEAQFGSDASDLRGHALTTLTWLRGALTIVALVWLLARIGRLVETGLNGFAARTERAWDDLLVPVAGRAIRLILPLIGVILTAPSLEVSAELKALIQNGISIALIAVIVAVLMQMIEAGSALILRRYPLNTADNLTARGVYTQVTVLRKVVLGVVGLFGLASMLMVFEPVRRIGTTLLASAGVAGIIIGFAAQRSLATLLAGFQIALSQPIRVDDVVIVEGEWGRIEEITLTYVVVAIWDERRLIVPINYFIEKPFQNWTRTGSQILGSVMLYTDYDVPLPQLRAELDRLLAATTLWDGRVKVLQVTEAKRDCLELRILVSSSDAASNFDLRCALREGLIAWIWKNCPATIPRLRTEWVGMEGSASPPQAQPASAS